MTNPAQSDRPVPRRHQPGSSHRQSRAERGLAWGCAPRNIGPALLRSTLRRTPDGAGLAGTIRPELIARRASMSVRELARVGRALERQDHRQRTYSCARWRYKYRLPTLDAARQIRSCDRTGRSRLAGRSCSRPDQRLARRSWPSCRLLPGSQATPGGDHRVRRGRLRGAQVPTRVNIVDSVPLTSVGKLDRKALAAGPPTETGDPQHLAPPAPPCYVASPFSSRSQAWGRRPGGGPASKGAV